MRLILGILLLATSLNCMAFYAKESELDQKVLDCTKKISTYLTMNDCGDDCVHAPSDFTCNTHIKSDEMIDDIESKVLSKNDIELCSGESDCTLKLTVECTDPLEERFINKEFTESWCSKFIRYNKKASGRKIFVVDQEKKDAHDAKLLEKKNRSERVSRGRVNREKCKAALDYVAGSNTDSAMTEEQIDAMETAFAPILDALQKNRPQKAARLITNVVDPAYLELKTNLLEILN